MSDIGFGESKESSFLWLAPFAPPQGWTELPYLAEAWLKKRVK